MSVSIDTIKHFLGKIRVRYNFKRKPDSQVEQKISTKSSVNEVMETIMVDENEPSTWDITWQWNRWRWLDGNIWPLFQLDIAYVRLTRTGYYHCHQWSFFTREKYYSPGQKSKPSNNSTNWHRDKYISCYGKILQVITSNTSTIKNMHTWNHIS